MNTENFDEHTQVGDVVPYNDVHKSGAQNVHKSDFVLGKEMITSQPLSPEQFVAWKTHVLSKFPEEACAYIVDGEIFPVRNVHENPTKQFAVNVLDRLEAEKGTITGFLHSHPATPLEAGQHMYPVEWPSTNDMKSWLADNTRWGISACDGENVTEPIWLDEGYIAPLLGRPFVHGIWDCYGVVRDWYRIHKGVSLMPMPRGMDWWNKGHDYYSENFEKAGFIEIKPEEVVPGDILLMNVIGDVIHHAAIVINGTTILHHCFSKNATGISCHADLQRWNKHIAKCIRYCPQQ